MEWDLKDHKVTQEQQEPQEHTGHATGPQGPTGSTSYDANTALVSQGIGSIAMNFKTFRTYIVPTVHIN